MPLPSETVQASDHALVILSVAISRQPVQPRFSNNLQPVRALLKKLVLIGLMAAAPLAAASGAAIVQAHRVDELRAPGPVWAVTADNADRLYLGTEQLHVLNGSSMQRIEVPGAKHFRALATVGNRVWVGATGNLGWVEYNAAGEPRFVSLLPQLEKAAVPKSLEVWSVHPVSGGAIFVTADRVLRWSEQSGMETWLLPCKQRLLAFSQGETIWIYRQGVGLLRMESTGPQVVWREEELPGAVLWALGTGDELLIGTIDGVFRREQGTWTRLPEASAALAGKLAVSAVRVDSQTVAVGTYLNGVVLFSPKKAADLDDKVFVIDRDSGLKDDSIHALWVDQNGNLWAGLAEGYARIAQPGQAAVFDERNGFAGGPVRTLLNANGNSVLVSSRAVQKADTDKKQLSTLPAVDGLLHAGLVRGREIWVAGFGGIWRTDGGPAGWTHEHYVSAEVHRLAMTGPQSDWIYYVEGFELKALVSTERGWATRTFKVNLGDAPVDLIGNEQGELWMATRSTGVWKFQSLATAERPPDLQLKAHFLGGVGLPEKAEITGLAPVGPRMFVFTETGILGPSLSGQRFVAWPAFQGLTGVAATKGGEAYWVVERREASGAPLPALVRIIVKDQEVELEGVPVAGLDSVGRITAITTAPDGAVWIGGSQGVLKLEKSALARRMPPPEARLTSVTVRGAQDTPTRLTPRQSGNALPADTRQVRFEFSAGALTEDARLQTAFGRTADKATATWTPPTLFTEREFSGLAAGSYVFGVRAADRFGRTGAAVWFEFTIPPPWWATWPAYAAYGLGVLLTGLGYIRWRTSRLRRQNQRLNQLVEERTRELAMANTAKGEFLANISHEIRNPLNGIVGLVGTLERTELPAEERELARSLGACVKALTRVFEEVLGFSKLEYGQVKVRPVPFRVTAVLDEVVRVFSATAVQRGNVLKLKVPPESDRGLRGDDEKIKTIVSNYVVNALKYAPGTLVEISASVEPVSGHGGEFCLCLGVTDHGPGVPADQQELIFRKFVRGPSDEVRREPGAGLGLATCRALAELMGGGVSIESPAVKAPNGRPHGATFYLHLTLPGAEVPVATPVGEDAQRDEPWLGRESGRALIVEDQEYNQMVIRRLTERLGFIPVVAGDAQAALTRFGEAPCAVVFLDWDLPDMKGTELARRIRGTPQGRDAIIFAATAHDSDEIRRKCREAGMDGFLLKPFDEAMVAAALSEVRRSRTIAEPGFNFAMFRYVGHDDPGKTMEAIGQYLALLDKELAALEAAVSSGNRQGVAHHAHRLLSHANVVRARQLGAAAHALEGAPDPIAWAALHQEVVRQAAYLRAQVEAFRSTTSETSAQL